MLADTSATITDASSKVSARTLLHANFGLGVVLSYYGLFGGDLLQVFAAVLLNAKASTTAYVISVVSFTSPLAIFGALLRKRLSALASVKVAYGIRIALLVALTVTAVAPSDGQTGWDRLFFPLIVSLAVSHAIFFTSSWPAIVKSVTEGTDRRQFLSLMRLSIQGTTIIAFGIVASLPLAPRSLFVAVTMGLISYTLFSWYRLNSVTLPGQGAGLAAERTMATGSTAPSLLATSFFTFLIVTFIARMIDAPASLYITIRELDLSASEAFWVSAGRQCLILATLLVIATGAVRVSHKRMLLAGIVISSAAIFLFASFLGMESTSPSRAAALLLSLGLVSVGTCVLIFILDTISFDVVSARSASIGLAIYGTVCSVSDALVQMLGGWALSVTEGIGAYSSMVTLLGAVGLALALLMVPFLKLQSDQNRSGGSR